MKIEKILSPVRIIQKCISDIGSRRCYCVASQYITVLMLKFEIFQLQSRYDPRILLILAAISCKRAGLTLKPPVGVSFPGIKQPNLEALGFPRLRSMVSRQVCS
jgi:hypothetical protein